MIKHGEENMNLLVLLEAEKPSAESGDCAVGELFCTGTGSIWCILSIFALTLCYMFLVYSFLSFFNLNFVLLYFSSIWVSFYYDVMNKEIWSWKPCLIFDECKVMYTAYGQVSLHETTDSILPEFLFKRSLKDFWIQS